MKFDCIIGNPPYQLKKNKHFYKQFVNRAIDHGNVVAMITPAGWSSLTKLKTDYTQRIINSGLTVYKDLGGKAFKNVKLQTSYFVIDKNDKTNNVKLNGQLQNRNNILYFPGEHYDNAIAKLINDAKNNNFKVYSGSLTRCGSILSNDKDAVNCIYTAGYTGEDFDYAKVKNTDAVAGLGYHKVIVTRQTAIGKLGVLKYADPTYGIGNNTIAINVNNKTEAESLIKYLNTDLIKHLIKSIKVATVTNSKSLFSCIPAVNLTTT